MAKQPHNQRRPGVHPRRAPERSGVHQCPAFSRCGACSLIDVSYEEQLARKQMRIEKLFSGVIESGRIALIKGMDDPFHYRNKVVSPFAPGRRKGDPPVLTGMYAKGTHRLVQTDGCLIENEIGNRVVRAIRSMMRKWKMTPYDEDTGTGFLRHVIVRIGHKSGEVLVTVVTNGEMFPSSKAFCRELARRVPEITSIVQNSNVRQTNVILGEHERTLYGPGFILDQLCGLSFRISSRSFYQVNIQQTEVLYKTAIEAARLKGDETFIDAYCGTGTIGLVAATCGAGRVIGVDSVASAIEDARQNALHNGITNATFYAQDATDFLGQMAAGSVSHTHIDTHAGEHLVLMMDPPRSGSTSAFLNAAYALAPERIIYISCNPETQVRDAHILLEGGYRLECIQPVDMFPHTDHIETIATFTRERKAVCSGFAPPA